MKKSYKIYLKMTNSKISLRLKQFDRTDFEYRYLLKTKYNLGKQRGH